LHLQQGVDHITTLGDVAADDEAIGLIPRRFQEPQIARRGAGNSNADPSSKPAVSSFILPDPTLACPKFQRSGEPKNVSGLL
jgi:hypothetical protein